MPKTRPPYPPEFRRQMVELVHTGRSPEGLAQVEPTAQSIRNWVGRAECDTGRRSDYLRQRERLLDYAASHIQHMQKALMQMNLQLHHVITGATGMRIIRAFVAGERNPVTLAALRDQRCKESAETIRQALVGDEREEHIFALAQAVELMTPTWPRLMRATSGLRRS